MCTLSIVIRPRPRARVLPRGEGRRGYGRDVRFVHLLGSAGVMVFPFSRRKSMSISRHCLFACYFSCFSPLLLREFWFLPNNTTGGGGGGGGGKKTLVKCADFLPLQKFLGSPRVAWREWVHVCIAERLLDYRDRAKEGGTSETDGEPLDRISATPWRELCHRGRRK